MQHALENQLIGVCFEPLREDAGELIAKFDHDEVDVLAACLATFLWGQAGADDGFIKFEVIDVDQDSGFKSILSIDRARNANKIISFSFKDAAADTFLPILGISATLYYAPFKLVLVPQIVNLLKQLWGKVVVLKRPEDSDCIDIIEAILQADVRRYIGKDKGHPTTERLRTAVDLNSETFDRAIRRLYKKKIIEIISWGGQRGDLAHNENVWQVKL